MSMNVAAAAAAASCPGRGWGHPGGLPAGVTPSPPQHFTFEPLVGPSSPPRPRRRHRRVLYPPAVRRPPPTEEPSAAKRLLVLLLAVVSAQVYNAPGDTTPEVAVTPEVASATAMGTPRAPTVTPLTPNVTSPPGEGALLRTAGTPWTPNGTLVGTPMGASCPHLLLSPTLRPHGHAAR